MSCRTDLDADNVLPLGPPRTGRCGLCGRPLLPPSGFRAFKSLEAKGPRALPGIDSRSNSRPVCSQCLPTALAGRQVSRHDLGGPRCVEAVGSRADFPTGGQL
jgi:hypothetical protein